MVFRQTIMHLLQEMCLGKSSWKNTVIEIKEVKSTDKIFLCLGNSYRHVLDCTFLVLVREVIKSSTQSYWNGQMYPRVFKGMITPNISQRWVIMECQKMTIPENTSELRVSTLEQHLILTHLCSSLCIILSTYAPPETHKKESLF